MDQGRISRRKFLRVMGAGAVAGSTLSVLSCQPNTSAQGGDDNGGNGGGSEEESLNFYIFSDYLTEDTVPRFERRSGAQVTLDFYTTNEEMLAKLQAGGSGYDLIVPSDYMVEIMVKEGMLLALDKQKSPTTTTLIRISGTYPTTQITSIASPTSGAPPAFSTIPRSLPRR